eukprot:344517-Chlamydomonas_euryale.AAC.1
MRAGRRCCRCCGPASADADAGRAAADPGSARPIERGRVSDADAGRVPTLPPAAAVAIALTGRCFALPGCRGAALAGRGLLFPPLDTRPPAVCAYGDSAPKCDSDDDSPPDSRSGMPAPPSSSPWKRVRIAESGRLPPLSTGCAVAGRAAAPRDGLAAAPACRGEALPLVSVVAAVAALAGQAAAGASGVA